jgi:hypothetical protein
MGISQLEEGAEALLANFRNRNRAVAFWLLETTTSQANARLCL